MALSGSLPQINLGVQGETQGVSQLVRLCAHEPIADADVDEQVSIVALTSPSVIHRQFFRVVRCSLVHCFQTRITLWNGSAAHAPIAG
ncbi:hypothetical protein TNCV_2434991 [Trichonephila clavipes]|nr:hypothetical protein TNCV_2434991 [Trichonephila clavipes]